MKKVIDEFKGDYSFLSNFYVASVRLFSIEFPTIEHAFQAAKTEDVKERLKIKDAKTPGEAKRMGRAVTLRKDWEEIKNSIMEELVHQKFSSNLALKAALLATGDADLIEGNTWKDRTWGMTKDESGKWVGENRLGKILMKVRAALKNGGKNG